MDKTLSLYKNFKAKNSFLACLLISSISILGLISIIYIVRNVFNFLYLLYIDLINYTLSFFPNNNIGFYSITIFLSILFYALVCHFNYRKIGSTTLNSIVFAFIFFTTANYFGIDSENSTLVDQSTFFCQFFYIIIMVNFFSLIFLPMGMIFLDLEKEKNKIEEKSEEQLNLDL